MRILQTPLKVIFFLSGLFISTLSIAQLPQNVNKIFGTDNVGTTQGTGSTDWHYSVKFVSGAPGDHVAAGYSIDNTASPAIMNPTIVKYDGTGAVIWEVKEPCILGAGLDIFELPNDYLVIAEGDFAGGSSCASPLNTGTFFSFKIDKTTGALNTTYGIKAHDASTHPFPGAVSPLTSTWVGSCGNARSHGCLIKDNTGAITGFMICGAYIDNNIPSNTLSFFNPSNGCFLLKLDLNGNADPSFGSSGLQVFFANHPASQYYQPHLYNVCVDYDGLGNPQGFVAVGAVNNNISAPSAFPEFNSDALMFRCDMSGNLTFYDIFDETTHFKTTASPASYIYSDAADPALCANVAPALINLPQENNNAKAVSVKQLYPGGNFIMLAQFDWTYYITNACGSTYPPSGGFILADPAAIRFDAVGNMIWATNISQSTGADFNNDLQIDFTGNVNNSSILVLGSTVTDTPGGPPVEQQAVISKLNFTGTLISEGVYQESTNGQLMYCPFSFDLDGTGGLIIVGDNDLSNDNYQSIYVNPY